jgi:hypothetical protein
MDGHPSPSLHSTECRYTTTAISTFDGKLRVFKMGKQRKYLVLAPLAPITASRTSLQQPQPTPEYIVGGRGGGLEVEYFEYYPHFSVLTGKVMHGLELTKND